MRQRRLLSCALSCAAALLCACASSEEESAGARDDRDAAHAGSSSGTASSPDGPEGGSVGEPRPSGKAECTSVAADPAAAGTIGGYLDKLPSGVPTGAFRAQLIDAILKSCHVYAPPSARNPGWKPSYCWAHVASAIYKESSYTSSLTIHDAYAKRSASGTRAKDPTVGLLQVRFSSTVHDYVALGKPESLSCAGCDLSASFGAHAAESDDSSFWAVTGPTQNLSMMQSVACNVGLGTWYYYVYATANGKPTTTTHLAPYCNGEGAGANVITGLLSHLLGPDGGRGIIPNIAGVNALRATAPDSHAYVTEIKGLFDAMVGPVAGTHPFFVPLAPNPSQYCR